MGAGKGRAMGSAWHREGLEGAWRRRGVDQEPSSLEPHGGAARGRP